MNLDLLWKEHFDSGAAGWTLAVTVVVLATCWGGLVFFYGGLAGQGRTAEAFRRMPILLCVASLAWGLWIFSLSFAPSWGSRSAPSNEARPPSDLRTMMASAGTEENVALTRGGGGAIGGPDYFALAGLAPQSSERAPHYPASRLATTLPHLAFLVLQMALFVAATAPLLVLTAGRTGIAGAALFVAAWGTLVYAPLVHSIWGNGWLARHDALDSGGGILQVGIGASALAFALFRLKGPDLTEPGANVRVAGFPLGAGALLFWAGALVSHSAVSALAGSLAGTASIALVNSHLAACAGLLAWAGADRLLGASNDGFGLVAGAIAGLAAISSCCGLIVPQSSLAVGAAGGAVGCIAYRILRPRAADPVPAAVFAVQAIPAMLGLLATGVFVTSSVSGVRPSGEAIEGLIEGNPSRLGVQALAAAAASAYAFAATLLCLAIVRLPAFLKGRGGATPAGEVEGVRPPLVGA